MPSHAQCGRVWSPCIDRWCASSSSRPASGAALLQLLAPGITWTVPGQNRIAGTYRSLEDVLGYFARRRDLAGQTFQMQRRDVLVGHGNRIAALTGVATIANADHRWSTVGLYDVSDEQITACWLLPLDQLALDAIWSVQD